MSLTGLYPIDKWNFKSKSVLNTLPDLEFEHLYANMTEKGECTF
jgi:hypothetical protein